MRLAASFVGDHEQKREFKADGHSHSHSHASRGRRRRGPGRPAAQDAVASEDDSPPRPTRPFLQDRNLDLETKYSFHTDLDLDVTLPLALGAVPRCDGTRGRRVGRPRERAQTLSRHSSQQTLACLGAEESASSPPSPDSCAVSAVDRRAAEWDTVGGAFIRDKLRGVYGRDPDDHCTTLVKYEQGGDDPLDGISVYFEKHPKPHWTYVTYGLTRQSEASQFEGFGFELTFRLDCTSEPIESLESPMHSCQHTDLFGNETNVGDPAKGVTDTPPLRRQRLFGGAQSAGRGKGKAKAKDAHASTSASTPAPSQSPEDDREADDHEWPSNRQSSNGQSSIRDTSNRDTSHKEPPEDDDGAHDGLRADRTGHTHLKIDSPPDAAADHEQRMCSHCGAVETVLWRQGPQGRGTLCNRCGVRWKRGMLKLGAGNGPNRMHALGAKQRPLVAGQDHVPESVPLLDPALEHVLGQAIVPTAAMEDGLISASTIACIQQDSFLHSSQLCDTPPSKIRRLGKRKQPFDSSLAHIHNPPRWPIHMLQNIARCIHHAGATPLVHDGIAVHADGPLCREQHAIRSRIRGIIFASDPQIQGIVNSPLGSFRFLQIVGITDDEFAFCTGNQYDSVAYLGEDGEILSPIMGGGCSMSFSSANVAGQDQFALKAEPKYEGHTADAASTDVECAALYGVQLIQRLTQLDPFLITDLNRTSCFW